MALNHGMPPIFTTTPIVGLLASAQAAPTNAEATSAEAAKNSVLPLLRISGFLRCTDNR